MRKLLLVLLSFTSIEVFAGAYCTNHTIEDCPWQYHARCHHVECINHKCSCHVWGDDDYFGRNYHVPLY